MDSDTGARTIIRFRCHRRPLPQVRAEKGEGSIPCNSRFLGVVGSKRVFLI